MEDKIPSSARKSKSRLINWLCRKICDDLPQGYYKFTNQDDNVDFFITPFSSRFTFIFYYEKKSVIQYEDPNWNTYESLSSLAGKESRIFFDGVDLYNRYYCLNIAWYTSRYAGTTFKIDISGHIDYPKDAPVINGPGDEKYSYLYITFSELNDRLSSKFNLDDLLSKTDSELLDMCKIMIDELLKYHKELFNHIYNQTIIPATKDWAKDYFNNLIDHVNDVEVFESLSLHELFDRAYNDE